MRDAEHLPENPSTDNNPDQVAAEQVTQLVAEAKREVMQSAQAIAELCMLANCPERAAEFIAAGKSQADVRRVLIDARAAKSDAADIRSTITVTGTVTAAPDADQLVVAPQAARIAEIPRAEGDRVRDAQEHAERHQRPVCLRVRGHPDVG